MARKSLADTVRRALKRPTPDVPRQSGVSPDAKRAPGKDVATPVRDRVAAEYRYELGRDRSRLPAGGMSRILDKFRRWNITRAADSDDQD